MVLCSQTLQANQSIEDCTIWAALDNKVEVAGKIWAALVDTKKVVECV